MSLATSLAPFRRERFRRLLLTQLVADIGDGVVTVALPLYVYERTGSATATSATYVAQVLVGVVFSMIGGGLADRRDRRVILLASYAVRLVLLLVLAAVSPLVLVLLVGVVARSMGMIDNPSFEALVPGLADGDLQQVIAARRFTQAASLLIGPAIGGAGVGLLGARTTLGLASIVFALAVIRILPMHDLDPGARERVAAAAGTPLGLRSSLASMTGGLTVIRGIPFARRLLAYWAVTMATVSMVMVTAIVWFDKDLGYGPENAWYGFAVGGWGSGSFLGILWAGGRTFRSSVSSILLRAIPLYAACAAIAVAAHTPWLTLVSWFLWGVATGPEFVVGETTLVQLVPEEVRGRVAAAQMIITQLGFAAGFGIAGPLVDAIGARKANLAVAAITLLFVFFWIGPYVRERAASRPAR